MSHYYAQIQWRLKENEKFVDNKYSRAHTWEFDGGKIIQASSSPHIVPLPYSVEANVDPEEAFIASLSSCHMLFFLSIAAKNSYTITNYHDDACGVLQKDKDQKMSITDVTLSPTIHFYGEKQPTKDQINKIHQQAHDQCFIANSVKTKLHIR